MIVNLMNILSILLILCILPTVWLVYKKKLTFFNGVFLGTFLFLVSFVCSVYGRYVVYGQSPLDIMISSTFDSISSAYREAPGISHSDMENIDAMLAEIKNAYSMLLPSMIVTVSLFWAYILFMLSKGVFALFKKDISGFMKFCDLKMPKMALFLAVISYFLSIVFKEERLGYAFMNFAEIIFMVTSVCGLSVIDYKFRKKLKISILRALIYIVTYFVLTIFTGLGGSILVFTGMMDSIFNFRKNKNNS